MLRVTTEQHATASWRSLFRTTRAPVSILAIAALCLAVPPQTGDELAALQEMHVGPLSGLVVLQLSLGFLSLSAWYWARAALSARFGVNDSLEARSALRRCSRATFNAVPRWIFLCGVVLSVSLVWRGFSWIHGVAVLLWAVPAYLLIHWRLEMIRSRRRQARIHLERLCSRRGVRAWLATVGPRLRALVMVAPFSPVLASSLLIVAVCLFLWGAFEGFLSLGDEYPGLAPLSAEILPGPSAAIVGLALAMGPLTALVFVMDGLRLERNLLGRSVGFTRPPIITAMLAWMIIAPLLYSYHTIRVLLPSHRVMAVNDRHSLDEFFDAWVKACAPVPDQPVRPIVVAVSGGASRAGIWGAQILGALEAADGHSNAAVFAVSSVSGGSLGAAAYLAIKRANALPCGAAEADRSAIAEQLARVTNHDLGGDALGPLLAGSLLNDTPRSLFSPLEALIRAAIRAQPRGGDRAEALERAFESLWRKDIAEAGLGDLPVPRFTDAFLSLFYDHGAVRPGMPVWVLNGTDVTSGGRMLTVPFGSQIGMPWPFYASIDLLGLLGADVEISTAINNSARFPYLEPSGEVVSVNDPPHQMHHGAPEVLDGGVFDNEGLEAALEIARWLKRKTVNGQPVQPIIVQATASADIGVAVANRVVRCPDAPIDVPTDPPPSPERLQLLAPVMGLYNVRAAHTALLLRHTRDEFCGGGRRAFFHFYLFSAPDRDIPLNWMLSAPAVAAIQQQLDSPGNSSELACLRKVLAGASTCGDTPATAFDFRVRSRPASED
jgi:hypothetical protein